MAVTRRAYRDGHNEYLLNSQHVRLRDMNELLAAAGLSERTYTIVGQGLVDASLALKADERRRLFEEAAGVGLYRVRREEALKRLENTRRNLERVQDIMAEIEPRLKTLERQARRANEYAAAQADLRAVLREWYGYHWHKSQRELQEALENVKKHQAQAQAAHTSLEANHARHARLRERMVELREQLASGHRDSAAQHQEQEAVGLSVAVAEERRRSLSNSIEALKQEQESLEGERALAVERMGELQDEVARAEGEALEAAQQLQAAQATLESRQTGRGTIEARLQAARDRLDSLHASRAEAQARKDALTAQLEYHLARIATAQESLRGSEVAVGEAEAALRRASRQRTASEGELRQAEARLDLAKSALANKRSLERETQVQQDALASRQSKLRAQLEILEQAEQSLSGYAEGARFLLEPGRQTNLRVRGALSGMLQLPADLEAAIAAALGDAVDTILLEPGGLESALEMLDVEEAGRAVMLPLETRTGAEGSQISDPDILGLASELVRASPAARLAADALLGTTYVVRTRRGGASIARQAPTVGAISYPERRGISG